MLATLGELTALIDAIEALKDQMAAAARRRAPRPARGRHGGEGARLGEP